MSAKVEIRMVQQLSGRRPDGRAWPEAGGVIAVDEDEARALCHTAAQQSHPIAELVRDPRKEERAVMTEDTERADPVPVRQARPEPRPARPAEKRG